MMRPIRELTRAEVDEYDRLTSLGMNGPAAMQRIAENRFRTRPKPAADRGINHDD